MKKSLMTHMDHDRWPAFSARVWQPKLQRVDQGTTASLPSAGASFDFDRYTKNTPFKLNTLPTTPYGPPWADIVMKPENFLECKGAAIALCYYSGPGPTTFAGSDGLDR